MLGFLESRTSRYDSMGDVELVGSTLRSVAARSEVAALAPDLFRVGVFWQWSSTALWLRGRGNVGPLSTVTPCAVNRTL